MDSVRDRSRPPVYRSAPEKVHEEELRPRLPGARVDGVFFLVATLAAVWLAWRLASDAWISWWHLLLLIPFWSVVAYLALPRLHRMLTRLYVPDYFFGRTRTSDGLLGDPVNLALDGTARQVHEAMSRAGWTLADDITLRSSWGIVVSSIARRSYREAPVSPLMIFGRQQCLAYQMEVGGDASKRHHVRFWRCPDGWLLPGGRRVQWLGAGTYDRAVGLSLFTLQVTHKIDADIDIERDFIVDSLEYASPEVDHEVIEGFSTGYHHVNGGGDRVHTDGDLPVLDLTRVQVSAAATPGLPHGVVRASWGYTDPSIDGALAAPDPDALPVEAGLRQTRAGRPMAIVFASLAVLATVAVQAAEITVPLMRRHSLTQTLGLGADIPKESAGVVAALVLVILAALLVAITVLCVLTYTGRARPRVWLMAGVTATIVLGEADRRGLASGNAHSLGRDLALGLSVLVLLGLSSPASRLWSRRTSQRRKLRRRNGRSLEAGSRRRS